MGIRRESGIRWALAFLAFGGGRVSWAADGGEAPACTPIHDLAAQIESTEIPHLNRWVLEAVSTMPKGGTYSTRGVTFTAYKNSISWNADERKLAVDPSGTTETSMCSSATSLVWLKVYERLLKHPDSSEIGSPLIERLLPKSGQTDGIGTWGRWNANGPGTAELFKELGLGDNFKEFARAQPGDFLKLWWNENVGARESGHSVVYRGCTNFHGVDFTCFWSSNMPAKGRRLQLGRAYFPPEDDSWEGGYSTRCVENTDIRRKLFSRFRRPEGDPEKVASYALKNRTLMDLAETKNLTGEEADDYLSGLTRSE